MSGGRNREDGSTFTWVIALCGICMIIAFGIAQVGSATRSAAMAQNAADAAALSGAFEIAHSSSSKACSSARSAALKNQSTVISCEYNEDEITIKVQLNTNSKVSAKARAEVD